MRQAAGGRRRTRPDPSRRHGRVRPNVGTVCRTPVVLQRGVEVRVGLRPVLRPRDDRSGGHRNRFSGLDVMHDQFVDGGEAVVFELFQFNKLVISTCTKDDYYT